MIRTGRREIIRKIKKFGHVQTIDRLGISEPYFFRKKVWTKMLMSMLLSHLSGCPSFKRVPEIVWII